MLHGNQEICVLGAEIAALLLECHSCILRTNKNNVLVSFSCNLNIIDSIFFYNAILFVIFNRTILKKTNTGSEIEDLPYMDMKEFIFFDRLRLN